MNQNTKIKKQNVGNVGEYYIASKLSALDFVTTITLGRAETYDILSLKPNGKVIKFSVKTSQNKNAIKFPLSKKDENKINSDFYYAFVRLNNSEPDFWIIPSSVVGPLIKKAHKKWENTPGKNNKEHSKTNSLRIMPVELKGKDLLYYPKNWEKEVKKYYKNLEQLL
jgi:hypothetical protein